MLIMDRKEEKREMKTAINAILTFFYLLIDKLKGNSKLIELESLPEDTLIVVIKMVFDYQVTITVKRKRYLKVFESRWFGSKEYFTFEVTGTCDAGTPESICRAFGMQYVFPRTYANFVPVKHHLDKAVDHFLDMVIQENIRDKQPK